MAPLPPRSALLVLATKKFTRVGGTGASPHPPFVLPGGTDLGAQGRLRRPGTNSPGTRWRQLAGFGRPPLSTTPKRSTRVRLRPKAAIGVGKDWAVAHPGIPA